MNRKTMNSRTKNLIGTMLIILGIIFVIRAFYVKDALIQAKNSKFEFSLHPLPGVGVDVSSEGDDAHIFSLQNEARNDQITGFILMIAGVAFLMLYARKR